ncbi:MAG: hypothetical protein ABW154_08100, partial [Dyella sp.]
GEHAIAMDGRAAGSDASSHRKMHSGKIPMMPAASSEVNRPSTTMMQRAIDTRDHAADFADQDR